MSDWTPAATDLTTRLKRASAAMTIYDEVGHDGVRRWSFYVGRSDAPIMWAGPYLSESDVLEAALLWQRGRP